VIINNADGGCGNDLAIDDITLSLENQQPEIVTPPDLSTCDPDGNGTEIFNLEDQIPTILNGQDPALFNVSFHNTQFEAEANYNPIATPNAYSNISNPETIYVRVEKVAEPSCFNTVSFQLILSDVEDLTGNLPAEVILCLGDDFPLLDATPSNPNIDLTLVTYEWTDGGGTVVSTDATYTPTAAGTYSVKVTYPPCSEQTFSVDIVVNDPPVVDLGEDEILCDGSSFEIVPVITGASPAITYLWSTGETTPTITVSESGIYTLTITDGPCTASDSIDIIISDPVIVDLGEDFLSCFDTDTILTAQVVGNPQTATYEWYLNGILLSDENNQTLFITQEGEYTVIVTVDSCVGEDSVVVSLRDDLEVSVGEDFITCPNEPQTITASTTEEGVTYQWFLNGELITGETNSNLDISLEPGLIGVQTYSVVITLGSCTATDSVDVSSYAVGNCVISEGISPNGDGYNDLLDLSFLNDRTGIKKLQIFNRLGTLVFEKNNYINEWFGQTNDGNDLPTGTYFYVIDLAGNDAYYGSQATGWIYLNQKAN
jgi:gliding motility-associated-like protein